MTHAKILKITLLLTALALALLLAPAASAHCDTLDGPVVGAARAHHAPSR